MKKFSKKGVLLFAGAMAVCAFAMPAMASAASWGTVGTHHTLTSSNLGFISDATSTTSMCAGASFTARVLSAADLQITASTFANCTLVSGAGLVCTATPSGTFSTPWTATAVTTSNIQIHGVDIDIPLDHETGSSCGPLAGQSLRITGTLTAGRWTGNGAGQHSVEVLTSNGLVSHSPPGFGGTNTITPTGTIGDGSLTVT